MNIVLIHQYFRTPEEGGGIRSYYIADYLTRLGHNVQVITAYNETRYTVKTVNGYKVHCLPIYYTNHLSFWSRIHAFWLFAYSAYRILKKLRPIDLNYVISTPLTTGLIALLAKIRLGIPYLFEVGDLWPAAPIQLGVLRNLFLIRLARKLEKATYLRAQVIIALSGDIKDHIASVAPDKEIMVITNMADIDFFTPSPRSSKKFTIGYLGTFGLANHLEYLIQAIKAAPQEVDFILMGSGAQYDRIRSMAEGLEDITWEAEGDKEKVKSVMQRCDAIYISFHHAPVLGTGCPNKLFDGLAAGKYIIINFEGWIRNLIESTGCGVSYDPRNPKALFERLSSVIQHPEFLIQAQEKSRQLAVERFSPEKQLAKLAYVVDKAVH
ncbi:MAG: glycosyltransferase family 4 protein [Bacteroidota bacterium]